MGLVKGKGLGKSYVIAWQLMFISCYFVGGLAFGTKALICGGYGYREDAYNINCYYHNGSGWAPGPSFREAKEFPTLVSPPQCDNSNLGVIAMGGRGLGSSVLNDMEVLKEERGPWRSDLLPEMPVQVWTHCTVYINFTTLMVIGGSKPDAVISNQTFFFNWETQTWKEGPTLLRGRNSHSCGRIKTAKESTGMKFDASNYSGMNFMRMYVSKCDSKESRNLLCKSIA